MNKKDIALTVGGVLATMVLAYLLYKLQQRDATSAAAASPTVSNDAEQYQTSPYIDDYAGAIAGVMGGTPITGTTGNLTPAVSTAADTADTGATGTHIDDSKGMADLFGTMLASFTGSITAQGATPETVASMTIPTMAGVSSSTLDSVPVTVDKTGSGSGNLNDFGQPIYYAPGGSGPGYYVPGGGGPPYMVSSNDVTSHPVTAHPITLTGA